MQDALSIPSKSLRSIRSLMEIPLGACNRLREGLRDDVEVRNCAHDRRRGSEGDPVRPGEVHGEDLGRELSMGPWECHGSRPSVSYNYLFWII
jgi:hypothetical protein